MDTNDEGKTAATNGEQGTTPISNQNVDKNVVGKATNEGASSSSGEWQKCETNDPSFRSTSGVDEEGSAVTTKNNESTSAVTTKNKESCDEDGQTLCGDASADDIVNSQKDPEVTSTVAADEDDKLKHV